MDQYSLGKDIQEIKLRLQSLEDANRSETNSISRASLICQIDMLANQVRCIENSIEQSKSGCARHKLAVASFGLTSTAPTEDQLENCVGKHISTICGNGYASDTNNHCAHFVGHTLLLNVGVTCRDLVTGSAFGASVRVNEIFESCTQVGRWSDLPTVVTWGLIFITNPSNVDLNAKTMTDAPRKHIGIFFGGNRTVYQYKNAERHVVKQTPEVFGQHYSSPDNGLFFGTI